VTLTLEAPGTHPHSPLTATHSVYCHDEQTDDPDEGREGGISQEQAADGPW
jgi:hypothetical protein